MRLIDADEIIKVAEHAYHEWNLAMAAADTNRQVNLTYKMQDLCKAVKAVAEAAPTIDPESLRPQGRCRYCSKDDGSGLQWDFDDIEVSVYLQCGVLTISNQYGEEAEMPINYCPNCGAKMTKDGDADD